MDMIAILLGVLVFIQFGFIAKLVIMSREDQSQLVRDAMHLAKSSLVVGKSSNGYEALQSQTVLDDNRFIAENGVDSVESTENNEPKKDVARSISIVNEDGHRDELVMYQNEASDWALSLDDADDVDDMEALP
jgi:hypothetical protein